MKFLVAYLGIGIAVFVGLWIWFRKTGVDREGLRILWGRSLVGEGIILVPLLWPLIAVLSLLWWAADYLHLKSKERSLREKTEAEKHANQYSHLTMDELLAVQKKKMLDESLNKDDEELRE